MIQDWHKKKKKNPNDKGDDLSLELEDISAKIPEIDNLLDEIEKSIKIAEKIQEETRVIDRCTC